MAIKKNKISNKGLKSNEIQQKLLSDQTRKLFKFGYK